MKRKLHISAVSFKGGRSNNEDNFYTRKRYPEIVTRDERYSYTTKRKNCCFAVADGMGGVQYGELASLVSIEYLSNHMRLLKKNPDKFFYKANSKVKKVCKTQGGTTFSCVIFDENKVKFYSIGDSPVYLYRFSSKELCQINELDNAAEKMDKESIDPLEYQRAKCQLMAFLGCGRFKNEIPYHYYEVTVETGDIIFLCTDGVDSVSSEEIKVLCESRGENFLSLSEGVATTALCNATQYGKRADNVTVIAIEVE